MYVFYEVLSIVIFLIINSKLTPDSEQIKEYKHNYFLGGCGELDKPPLPYFTPLIFMTYALQNACLNGCAYLTIPVAMYISLYFHKIGTPTHDNTTRDSLKSTVLRVIVFCLISITAALPALLIKLEYVGSPIIIMLVNIIVPGAIVSFVLIAGTYDRIIEKFQ